MPWRIPFLLVLAAGGVLFSPLPGVMGVAFGLGAVDLQQELRTGVEALRMRWDQLSEPNRLGAEQAAQLVGRIREIGAKIDVHEVGCAAVDLRAPTDRALAHYNAVSDSVLTAVGREEENASQLRTRYDLNSADAISVYAAMLNSGARLDEYKMLIESLSQLNGELENLVVAECLVRRMSARQPSVDVGPTNRMIDTLSDSAFQYATKISEMAGIVAAH